MIVRFLWGYLCLTGIATILIYCACLAAAQADHGRKPSANQLIQMLNGAAKRAQPARRHFDS